MAAVVSSYPPNLYHQQSYINPTLTSFYVAQYIHNHYYKSKLQKQQKQQSQPRTPTPTPTKATEHGDSNVQKLRPRREPRIHRQVILLPTPEPIYRQVRHRLPTPERQVIQRTVIQKANGDVLIQQQRHRKKTRRHSRSQPTAQPRSPGTRQMDSS